MATSINKNKKIVNAIEEDLEQLSSYDGDVAKRFFSFIKPYKTKALLGVISVITFTIAVLAIPLLVKFTIDNAISDNNESLLNNLFILLIGFALMHLKRKYCLFKTR